MSDPGTRRADWQPTPNEARIFAQGLELQVPGMLMLQTLFPEAALEALPTLAERWEQHPLVRASRFDLRQWLEATLKERMTAAKERTINGMCWYLRSANVATLTGSDLKKALTFFAEIEKQLQLTAIEKDMAAKFWEEFTARKNPPTMGGAESKIGLPPPIQ